MGYPTAPHTDGRGGTPSNSSGKLPHFEIPTKGIASLCSRGERWEEGAPKMPTVRCSSYYAKIHRTRRLCFDVRVIFCLVYPRKNGLRCATGSIQRGEEVAHPKTRSFQAVMWYLYCTVE